MKIETNENLYSSCFVNFDCSWSFLMMILTMMIYCFFLLK